MWYFFERGITSGGGSVNPQSLDGATGQDHQQHTLFRANCGPFLNRTTDTVLISFAMGVLCVRATRERHQN